METNFKKDKKNKKPTHKQAIDTILSLYLFHNFTETSIQAIAFYTFLAYQTEFSSVFTSARKSHLIPQGTRQLLGTGTHTLSKGNFKSF